MSPLSVTLVRLRMLILNAWERAPIGVRFQSSLPDSSLLMSIQLTLFIGSMGLMEGRDLKHVQQRFSDMYRSALLANWRVWPLAQVYNNPYWLAYGVLIVVFYS